MRLHLIALVVLAAATTAHAQSIPRTKSGRPDLSGYWMLNDKVPSDAALMAKLPPGAVVLHDTGAAELPRGDYGGLKLKPTAVAAAKAWDPRDDLALDKVCSPPSIVYAMQGPFPLEIHQGTELIVFKLEYYDMVRIVFMDGRKHLPADAPHSKVGHSIGRWEGDVLVVDTDHLAAATLTNNGLGHSDDVHVVERFRLSPDGKTLLSTQEFDDPAVLDSKGARFVAWSKEAGYVGPYDCDPSFSLNYGEPDAAPK